MTTPVHTSGAVDLAPSFVRTLVPIVVGPLIARYGFDVNDPTTALLISGVAGYVYYVIVRLVELKAPTLGYLLGVAKQPTYVTPPAVVMDESGTRVVGDDTDIGPVDNH